VSQRVLIINADDFGLTAGICRAVVRAASDGVVSSTSALVTGPAFADHVGALADAGIGVGAHLAAVGHQPPLLAATEIPSLVDRRGRLAPDWRTFLRRYALGRIDSRDLTREFGAQVAKLRDAGISPTHVDTHQNLHLWPGVARVVVAIAQDHQVPAIRVTRSAGRAPVALVVRALAPRLARRATNAGLAFPAASVGLDEAGRLDRRRLEAALVRLAAADAPTAEVACHPGEADDAELVGLGWGYHWAEELDALTAPEIRATIERGGFRLGSYRDLVTASVPVA